MGEQKTAGLRFGAMTRVSTEAQARRGSSLALQREQLARDADLLGGEVTCWYGGTAEHATEGWERKELRRLIADAKRGLWDAVMVAHADRWDRGSDEAKEALKVFKERRVRFFISVSEYDLFNPEHVMFLGLSAVIGKFQADNQNKKSILNKIKRARGGWPATGSLPFGRTWSRGQGWGIDPAKQALLVEVAGRYVRGESLVTLAREKGVDHRHLHKVLMERSGGTWVQTFESESLGIKEEVPTAVPPLLPEELQKAVRARAEANKTYLHGQAKHAYLLGRVVFCGHCGTALSGWVNGKGDAYYMHRHPRRLSAASAAARACPDPRALVRADELEAAVLHDLWGLFGNPQAVLRAVREATPDHDEQEENRKRQVTLRADLDEVRRARARVLRHVSKGDVSEEDASGELRAVKEREDALKGQLEALERVLADAPDPEEVERAAREIGERFRATKRHANSDLAGMSWQDRRSLVQMVFAGRSVGDGSLGPAGERRGVYVRRVEGQRPHRRQQWNFRLVGRVAVDFWGSTPPPDMSPEEAERLDSLFHGPDYHQEENQEYLLRQGEREGVTTSSQSRSSRAEQVVPRLRPPLGGDLGQVGGQLAIGLRHTAIILPAEGALAAGAAGDDGQLVGPVLEARPVLGRHAEHLGDDRDG
jgi:DNA invertase Pin-like site-specific DNA recombinase